MTKGPQKIFIGGYTKSGTTFIGRALGLFNNVYAKGELDYFRLFYTGLHDMVVAYNENLAIVNREVYDGHGDLDLVTVKNMRGLQDKVFQHLFFNGGDVPDDCKFIVEKSPRNIFHIAQIEKMFPDALNVCVYREPKTVFRSLVRHLADHRHTEFQNPAFQKRRELLNRFVKRWNRYIDIIETNREKLNLVRYQQASDDNQAFLDYAEKEILGFSNGLRAPVETLSKEHYLKSLPKENRAKSLVQTGPYKITLTDGETDTIGDRCREPDVSFDF